LVDYVEVPYELLRHDPRVLGVRAQAPIVLHCASLSVGGTVPCPGQTLDEIEDWVAQTDTPWIGEHLAFITAERRQAGPAPQAYAPGEPYNVGYTVSPPMNEETLQRTVRNLDCYQERLPVPLLVENSPLYFKIPTSTMTQTEFLRALCERTRVVLLLDLAHLYITSRTMGFDPLEELERFPLEKVVEVHLSGVDEQGDGLWDDHARRAPGILYRMLEQVVKAVIPRAVTLEYNWSTDFPTAALLEELEQTRETLRRCRAN
jgi:uncharacterized protein (UPF0276 family)